MRSTFLSTEAMRQSILGRRPDCSVIRTDNVEGVRLAAHLRPDMIFGRHGSRRRACQYSTLSSTISARNVPCSAVMRPTVTGRRKRPGTARIEKECAVLCLDLGLVRMTIDHRVDVVGSLGVKLGQNV